MLFKIIRVLHFIKKYDINLFQILKFISDAINPLCQLNDLGFLMIPIIIVPQIRLYLYLMKRYEQKIRVINHVLFGCQQFC